MAEAGPLPSSTSNPPSPPERIPSHTPNVQSRRSMTPSPSRPQSPSFPAFQSSLIYTSVRDFAYPSYHPFHYGPPSEPPSDASTPGSDAPRRLSDPQSDGLGGTVGWSAGPWGGDGVIYGDPDTEEMEPLPATSFGNAEDAQPEEGDPGFAASQRAKQRKSKSYANIGDYERGRKRDSSGSGNNFRRNNNRVSQASAASGESDMFLFQGTQHFHPANSNNNGRVPGSGGSTQLDPAGASSLRNSRGYQAHPNPPTTSTRRESRQLPPRAFHASQQNQTLDSDLPLDTEPPSSPSTITQQRESIGPEDELFAGESLALYSFEPENANELRLMEGQIILVSYRHGQGWLVAEDPNTGERGLVPEEYVRLLSEMEGWDGERGTSNEDDDDEEVGREGLTGEGTETRQATETQRESDSRAQKADRGQGSTDHPLNHHPRARGGTEPADPDILQALMQDTDALEMVDSHKSMEPRQDSAHAQR